MKVCIHRGAKEIGGTCVEIEAAGKRIVLDVGLPLDTDDSEELLPAVRGFREPDRSLLAVVISHPHQDHYGLVHHLRPDLPVLIGEAAHQILRTAGAFSSSGAALTRTAYLKDRRPIKLGPFEITPYLVDHSAYDAYAFLVSDGGKRLFYSGDVRGHGRKARAFEALLKHPPPNIDVLLMEGTTIGRNGNGKEFQTERELEQAFVERFKTTLGLCLVWTSGQNIDRLVTVFKACKRSGRRLIVDLYTAEILRATGNPNIPQGTWKEVLVYVPEAQRRLVKRKAMFEMVKRYRQKRIFPEDLAEAAGHSVMLFRPSMAAELERARCLSGARLIYSLWEGYLKQERLRSFHAWLARHKIPIIPIHTSGHAPAADLQRLAKALRPKSLVPIHSEMPGRFGKYFERVALKSDGVWWEV